MPGGDRTGPAGFGPRTGRGMGYCNGYQVPGYMNGPVYGRGFGRAYGRGFGRGAGWGYRYPVNPGPVSQDYNPAYYEQGISKESEAEYLKNTARALEEELNYIKERLSRLEKDNGE